VYRLSSRRLENPGEERQSKGRSATTRRIDSINCDEDNCVETKISIRNTSTVMPLSSSTYRDYGDNGGDDNDFAPSEVSPTGSSGVVAAPPMSTFQTFTTSTTTTTTPAPRQRSNFRTLTTFANNRQQNKTKYDEDIGGGFTEGHFVDEQMDDRVDYLNNMDQFTQQSNNMHSISSMYPLSRTKKEIAGVATPGGVGTGITSRLCTSTHVQRQTQISVSSRRRR
jgi:hypothetical protein